MLMIASPHPAGRGGSPGKLFGDRGYISKELFAQLWAQDVQLITKLKKNMKPKLLPLLR